MPNFLTHLAIAKRFAEKNNMKGDDARNFYDGNIYPDLEVLHSGVAKKDTHYNKPIPKELTVENFCRDRVDFKRFLEKNRIETHFEKGVLMHLIVDNFCYPAVLDMERFFDMERGGIRGRWIVTGTFNSINDYLKAKYNINFEMTSMHKEMNQCLEKWAKDNGEIPHFNLLDTPQSIEKLDDFIEEISSIDLEKFARKFK